MAAHVFNIGEAEGRGKSKTAARDAAIARAAEMLSGSYYPEIYEHRGHVLLLHRQPNGGWQYSFVGRPDEGIRSGSVLRCPSVCGSGDVDGARRGLLKHLADLGWRPEDGTAPPDFITNEADRAEFERRKRDELFYVEAREVFGIDNHEACMYYVERRKGSPAQYVPASPEWKERVDAVVAEYPHDKFSVCCKGHSMVSYRVREGNQCFECDHEVRPATEGEEALWNLDFWRENAPRRAAA